MFSWLNFEELLIHNPIELINPSKDTISVAMSKKQYIEFFSNKYTYNGVYYDEEMDFCLFYYADPLQSYKEGDMYAQEYIDVEMKIYRVKWLCNVSINRFNYNFNLLEGDKATPYMPSESEATSVDFPKWNVSKTEMIVNTKTKVITTVLNGALAKCTKDKDVTGWRNSQPNANYNYRQPQYSLDIGADDFIISGFGLRGLRNG